MEIYRDLCRYWKDRLSDLRKTGDKETEVANFVRAIRAYENTISYYDDVEIDMPAWLADEMRQFFRTLEMALK